MKKLFFTVTVFASILTFESCKRKVDIETNFPAKPVSVAQAKADGKLLEVFNANAPQAESTSFDASVGTSFTNSKGTTYTIDPDIFVKQDGSPVTGEVTVKVREISRVSEMILADKPTVTNDGQMLESFGEFKVDAIQGTDILKLKEAAVVRITVVVRDTINVGMAKGIPMWDGDTIAQTALKGYNYVNEEVTVVKEYVIRKGIDWTLKADVATQLGSRLNMTIDKLGTWHNCDALFSDGAKTTVIGYYNNVFNESSSASNLLFFKRAGTNTLIKLCTNVIDGPSDKQGYLSYQNSFPIGMFGSFIAIVYKDGKFYTAIKDVTIAPESGKTFMGIDFTLTERTEAEMLDDINLMNSK